MLPSSPIGPAGCIIRSSASNRHSSSIPCLGIIKLVCFIPIPGPFFLAQSVGKSAPSQDQVAERPKRSAQHHSPGCFLDSGLLPSHSRLSLGFPLCLVLGL